MSHNALETTEDAPTGRPLLWTAVSVLGLLALLLLAAAIEEDGRLGPLAPHRDHLRIGALVLFGYLTVHNGTTWAFAIARRRTPPDVAVAVRVIVRLAGYGLLFSILVSALTDNAAAALTLGSFAGLVAGFASQTVVGNMVAGLYIAFGRPIAPRDRVTVGGNSGEVADITLMHIVLETDDRTILIPSSRIASAVLVKHKPGE